MISYSKRTEPFVRRRAGTATPRAMLDERTARFLKNLVMWAPAHPVTWGTLGVRDGIIYGTCLGLPFTSDRQFVDLGNRDIVDTVEFRLVVDSTTQIRFYLCRDGLYEDSKRLIRVCDLGSSFVAPMLLEKLGETLLNANLVTV